MITYHEILQQIPHLTVEERKRLIHLIVDTLADASSPSAPKKHSILELAGLGADAWEGIDPQEYVRQMRSEWDDRP